MVRVENSEGFICIHYSYHHSHLHIFVLAITVRLLKETKMYSAKCYLYSKSSVLNGIAKCLTKTLQNIVELKTSANRTNTHYKHPYFSSPVIEIWWSWFDQHH